MERIKDVLNNSKVNNSVNHLSSIYNCMPGTTGCMDSLKKCKGWCCRLQNPQVLYSEFLNSWKYVLENWDTDDIVSLIRKALENYLTDKVVKGCIFWDSSNKTCKQHETRCFNCRMYGIVPPEDFKKKLEAIRREYNDPLGLTFRDQCPLVETIDGKDHMTQDQYDKLWDKIKQAEKLVGLNDNDIYDGQDGSYLTYHDHLLLQIFPEEIIAQLTQIRLHGKDEEKEMTINNLIDQIYNNIERSLRESKNG